MTAVGSPPAGGARKGRRAPGRMTRRLRVRGKLNVLVLLPLAAVLLVAVPFVTGEVRSAQSAATTAALAGDARQLGGLVWELQRERLLTAGYLVSPQDDGVSLKRQQQLVSDGTANLLRRLGPDASDELVASLTRIGSLGELRASALARGASLDSVARAYHAVVEAMIEALRLVPQRTSDAEGTRQLTALDALLRANEESALRGMALIVAASDPRAGTQLLQNAVMRSEQLIERFVEQADVSQAGQVVNVEQGEAARRVDAIAGTLTGTPQRDLARFAAGALAAVDAQSSLRRVVQDRVTGEIADAAAGRATSARITAWAVAVGTALVFLLVTALTLTVSRSIAGPLRRLTAAAINLANVARAELVRVSDEENLGEQQSPQLPAIDVASHDEIGDLAVAFNMVQATASELVERQIVSRRNVSLMFVNIAQRTRNLVGRQLTAVDDLERNEQNPTLLAGLYRLDHLATRLRRNAENLLVLAGSRAEARIKRPTPLSTIIRGALTEIEEYERVDLDMKSEITVTPEAAADLVLIFAELLENATMFSPPESPVRVRMEPDEDGCRILVIDQGIGMTPQRLEEENRRLVERERLDIAPTRVLGLFVVGRLARRHGLTVELSATPDGGTTATVRVPAAIYWIGSPGEPAAPVESVRATAAVPLPPAISAAFSRTADGFAWFFAKQRAAELPAAEFPAGSLPAAAIPPTSLPAAAIPPTSLPAAEFPAAEFPAAGYRAAEFPAAGYRAAEFPAAGYPAAELPAAELAGGRDPVAEGARMQQYQAAIGRAAPAAAAVPAQRTGGDAGALVATVPGSRTLTRRVPGAHLAPALREQKPNSRAGRPEGWRPRDPDAERKTFDSFTTGWARATAQTGNDGSPTDRQDETTMERWA